MKDFFFRNIATATFEICLGGIETNRDRILETVKKAAEESPAPVDVVVFPELCLTGYTCADMFLRQSFADRALENAAGLAKDIKKHFCEKGQAEPIVAIGLPVRTGGRLYNCAAILAEGRIEALVPKTYLPAYGEYYEKRWFAGALDAAEKEVFLDGQTIPFGTDILVERDGLRVGCELCEDLWVVEPPSGRLAIAGANLIINPSASNDIVTKREYRTELVRMQSARCLCAYAYVSAGWGESTTDLVYSGHHIIAECGSVKADSAAVFDAQSRISFACIDIEKIENDKIKTNSHHAHAAATIRRIRLADTGRNAALLPDRVNPYPFIPADKDKRKKRCEEILSLQAAGLASRLKKTGMKKCVIGISGGLDSTLALIVTKEAYRMLGLPFSDIIAVTMPGFGTTVQTKTSADGLMEALGVTSMEVDIKKACLQHMEDIGQPQGLYDVTYENIQARERTQILMDLANKEGGLVVGTGDLSELALGWCTYNGDHMSMYAVNVSVPKTLVRFVIETYAAEKTDEKTAGILRGICDTIISPELLPPDEKGHIRQSTEETIGKYDLHDFFLYHFIRNGFALEKVGELACAAFKDLPRQKILDTLETFRRRFVTSQFKRSCIPDGPKVGSVALSPRGDWRMPSDFQGKL